MSESNWRSRLARLRDEVTVLASALGDPKVPWYAKLWIGLIVAYVVSPIDLIPDFIPVLGLLDELIVVPIGIVVARWLIGRELLESHREDVADIPGWLRTVGGIIIVSLWIALAWFSYRWMVASRSGA